MYSVMTMVHIFVVVAARLMKFVREEFWGGAEGRQGKDKGREGRVFILVEQKD